MIGGLSWIRPGRWATGRGRARQVGRARLGSPGRVVRFGLRRAGRRCRVRRRVAGVGSGGGSLGVGSAAGRSVSGRRCGLLRVSGRRCGSRRCRVGGVVCSASGRARVGRSSVPGPCGSPVVVVGSAGVVPAVDAAGALAGACGRRGGLRRALHALGARVRRLRVFLASPTAVRSPARWIDSGGAGGAGGVRRCRRGLVGARRGCVERARRPASPTATSTWRQRSRPDWTASPVALASTMPVAGPAAPPAIAAVAGTRSNHRRRARRGARRRCRSSSSASAAASSAARERAAPPAEHRDGAAAVDTPRAGRPSRARRRARRSPWGRRRSAIGRSNRSERSWRCAGCARSRRSAGSPRGPPASTPAVSRALVEHVDRALDAVLDHVLELGRA